MWIFLIFESKKNISLCCLFFSQKKNLLFLQITLHKYFRLLCCSGIHFFRFFQNILEPFCGYPLEKNFDINRPELQRSRFGRQTKTERILECFKTFIRKITLFWFYFVWSIETFNETVKNFRHTIVNVFIS